MKSLNVRDTREQLSHLLDAVAAGEEVVIVRRGRAVARLTGPAPNTVQFPRRDDLRADLPPMTESAAETVSALRDEARY